jgi:hypothetical protein
MNMQNNYNQIFDEFRLLYIFNINIAYLSNIKSKYKIYEFKYKSTTNNK